MKNAMLFWEKFPSSRKSRHWCVKSQHRVRKIKKQKSHRYSLGKVAGRKSLRGSLKNLHGSEKIRRRLKKRRLVGKSRRRQRKSRRWLIFTVEKSMWIWEKYPLRRKNIAVKRDPI